MGIIIPGDEYPCLSSHLPPKSPVLQQCEKNDTAEWADELKEAIAARCQNLENAFPLAIKHMDEHIPKWVQRTYSEVDLLLIKRDWIRKHWFTKKNIGIIQSDVRVILKPLALSEIDIREEENLIKGYFLMAAEWKLQDQHNH